MSATKRIEGVPYYRFRLAFKSADGKRRQATLWSPGHPWLGEEVTRYLNNRGDVPRGARVVVSGPS